MRMRSFCAVALLLALPTTAFGLGIPADVPFVIVDPRVDGADSFVGEWTGALIVSDAFVDPTTGTTPAGQFYFENKTDWLAKSSTGASALYPGPTFFIAHDIFGAPAGLFSSFRTNDPGDWNSIKAVTPGGTVECWNFGGFSNPTAPPHVPAVDVNAPDDGVWLPDAAGLGASSLIPEGLGPDLINDRGFIVRLNGNPASDKHWFPGDPEPGDPGWSWDTYYGCFARAGFNKTFQDNGTDPVVAHAFNHEVYEWCFHAAALPGVPPPLQCLEWRIELVDPPKRWIIYFAPNWKLHFGPPPIPATPWPSLAAFAVLLGAGGAFAFRRRRRPMALLLLGLISVSPCLAACGGSSGNDNGSVPVKFPPPLQIPIPVLKEGWVTQIYSDQLQATGQNPPFTFQLTAGNLPGGLNLAPQTGVISGNPTTPGSFSFEFSVTDALGNSAASGSAIHIGDPALAVPIQIVSLSLVSVNPILVVKPGIERIGSIQAKGGNYNAVTTWQLAGPPPNGAFLLSQGGVIRWTPPLAHPIGPILVPVTVTNGGPPIPMQLQFDVQP